MATKLVTVNNAGSDEQIVAQSVCSKITFGEDESVTNFPTVNWFYKSPTSTDYIKRSSGSRQVFQKPNGSFYQVGELVAYVKTETGSSSFAQEES